jgi:A/G-specific adenine glycosylase
MKNNFKIRLLQWHLNSNKRQMPWKGEKDPYKIWLSEVILQQTRVGQGWNYYERFVEAYPTIIALANAKDDDVFKLWEGLGYYNRCKNLLFTARQINRENRGVFPKTYDELISLKGIGPYTAAAIASFAFNLPYAVVDGNVFRVLARVFGIEMAIDSTDGKKEFTKLANEALEREQPGVYNQAIMDFGAVVCKPVAPLCSTCVQQSICKAYRLGKVNYLPVNDKKILRKHRWFYYFLFEFDGKLLVNKRTRKDIWENLFEFYLLETDEQIKWTVPMVYQWMNEQFNITKAEILNISETSKQQLTHQQIKGQFIKIKLCNMPAPLAHYQWQPIKNISELAFPKFINQYLSAPYLKQSLF